jgi:hypothetical protein
MTECTLMPPFFFPVFGLRPTPLKMRFENKLTVVESMICNRFIHFGTLWEGLSDKSLSL